MKHCFRLVCVLCLCLLPLGLAARKPNGGAPTTPEIVRAGLYLVSIHDLNFREKEYTARFWLWLFYTNPELDFENTLEIPNAKEFEKQEVLLDSLVNEQGKTVYWLQMKIRAVMKQSWHVRDYPFDSQTLMIKLENSKFDTRFMNFAVDNRFGDIYDRYDTTDGWRIARCRDTVLTDQYLTNFGDPYEVARGNTTSNYSQLVLETTIRRDAWGLFWKLFIGLYVAVAIGMVGFIINPQHIEPRFALPVGGLFATVGNKYVIDSILPETSAFTLVDVLHTASYLFIFGIIAIFAVTLYRMKRGTYQNARRLDLLAGGIAFAVYLVFNVVMVVLAVSSNGGH